MSGLMIPTLYVALMDWAIAQGAEQVKNTLWRGETDQWDVVFNGYKEEVTNIPALSWQLSHKTAFVGFAIVGPSGGEVAGGSARDLEKHFRDLTPESAS